MTSTNPTNPHNPDASRLLEDAARIGVPGMAAKSDKPLTDAERKEIIDTTREFQTRHGLTDQKLAKQVGKSYATVRAVLKGEYGADPDPTLRTIRNKINENRKRLDAPGDGEFVMTALAREAFAVATMIVQTSSMGAVTAPAGCGKSMALKAMLGMNEFDRAVYVVVKRFATVNALCRSLTRAVGEYSSPQSSSQLFDRIVGVLAESNRLVIIDEAQYLDRVMLTMVRQLHDEAGCPVLLAGTPALRNVILGDGVDSTVSSRIRIYRDLTARSQRGHDNPLHSLDDIRRIFAAMKLTYREAPVRLDPDALAWMHDVANLAVSAPGKGDLRMACGVVRHAFMLFKGRAEFVGTITRQMLNEVSEHQIGLDRAHDLANRITLRKAAG